MIAKSNSELLTVAVVVVCASLWGIFWLPLRAFESAGLAAGWATLAQFVTPVLVLLPAAVLRTLRRLPIGLTRFDSGLLVGSAFVLYFESLLLTDVVRALVLFYITPAWGTLLEVTCMGRRLTARRALALVLGFSGLLVILGVDTGVPLPRNLGDWMAFAGGITFAIGSMRVRQAPQVSVFEQVFSFFLYGTALALVLVLLPIPEMGQAPDLHSVRRLTPWLLLMAACFLIPVMWGLLWGSQRVDPGRLGILLQMEAIIGIGSAALFAGEPFGWREATGAILVVGAAMCDALTSRPRPGNPV